MDGGRKASNKGLVGVLAVLCVVIVGLVVGIVVVNLNAGRSQETEVVEETEELTPEQVAYYDYVADFDKVQEQARGLLASGANASEIVALYSPYIAQCLKDGAVDRASSYIQAEQNDLLGAGYKQAALDELLNLDFSAFNAPEQYKYYTDIIEMANDLGRSDVATEYAPLAAQTKEAYDRNYAASERAAAEGAAIRERAQRNQESEE